jgi:hypothetical protein
MLTKYHIKKNNMGRDFYENLFHVIIAKLGRIVV